MKLNKIILECSKVYVMDTEIQHNITMVIS